MIDKENILSSSGFVVKKIFLTDVGALVNANEITSPFGDDEALEETRDAMGKRISNAELFALSASGKPNCSSRAMTITQ